MLIDGGLAIDNGEFVIFINCENEEIDEYKQRYWDDSGRSLPSRIRFTIAHELIHTFFFEWKGGKRKPKLAGSHYKEAESLESACDYGANHLLLPPRVLEAQLEIEADLSPPTIRNLSKKFHVSLETLLIGLAGLRSWGRHDGFIALVTEEQKSLTIKATAADPATRQYFSQFRRNQTVIAEHHGIEALEGFGGTETRIPYSRHCRIGSSAAIQPFVAMSATVPGTPKRVILSFKAAGYAKAVE